MPVLPSLSSRLAAPASGDALWQKGNQSNGPPYRGFFACGHQIRLRKKTNAQGGAPGRMICTKGGHVFVPTRLPIRVGRRKKTLAPPAFFFRKISPCWGF